MPPYGLCRPGAVLFNAPLRAPFSLTPMADAQTPDWRAAFATGDRDAFQQAVQPYMNTLMAAARRDLRYYQQRGALKKDDLTIEEVVGEGLVQAWDRRDRVPPRISLKGWLLAVQHRAARGLAARERGLRREGAFSLDGPLPSEGSQSDHTQEWFWEWYQPDNVMQWEDITPGRVPVDVEINLEGDRADALEGDARHVLMLHDEFDMEPEEVAFTLGRSVNEIAQVLQLARSSLRERLNENGIDLEGNPPAFGDPDRAG